MSLKRKLAQHGFESNEDFGFALSCVLEGSGKSLRTLELVGKLARRKTAFAQALGLALEFSHRLYVDFSEPEPIVMAVELKEMEEVDAADPRLAKPLNRFERTLLEACAFSESDKTILVLDQLQALPFADQMRLFHFVQSGQFSMPIGESGEGMRANSRNLLLVLISTQDLYHSLQKSAFRILTDPTESLFDLKPADFNLPAHAEALFQALATLLQELTSRPTASEIELVLKDLDSRVRTVEQLRIVLFGRIENQSREELYQPLIEPFLQAVIQQLEQLLGIDEVELSSREEQE